MTYLSFWLGADTDAEAEPEPPAHYDPRIDFHRRQAEMQNAFNFGAHAEIAKIPCQISQGPLARESHARIICVLCNQRLQTDGGFICEPCRGDI